MDIGSFYNVSSKVIRNAAENSSLKDIGTHTGEFATIFDKAIENLETTNSYLSDAENEELKWALGETDNTHELTIALQKASTSLQYTVAVRDKVIEAYKEIMQMQI